MKVLKFIDEQFEKWFLIVSLIVMVLVTFMQIVLRWFNAATVWAEEFSRYVMLYQVWVGASYAVHEDAHHPHHRPDRQALRRQARGMDLVVLTLWLLFALWLTVEGCVLVGKIAAMGQVSSAMRIPMTIPYASVPIGGALMTIRLVQKIVERLRNTQEEEA